MKTKRRWFLSLPGFAILASMLVIPLLLQVLTSLGLAKNSGIRPQVYLLTSNRVDYD